MIVNNAGGAQNLSDGDVAKIINAMNPRNNPAGTTMTPEAQTLYSSMLNERNARRLSNIQPPPSGGGTPPPPAGGVTP